MQPFTNSSQLLTIDISTYSQIAQLYSAHTALDKTWQPANVRGFLVGHRGGRDSDGGCGPAGDSCRWPVVKHLPAPGEQKIIIIMQVSRGKGVFNGCRPHCTSGVLVTSCVMWHVTSPLVSYQHGWSTCQLWTREYTDTATADLRPNAQHLLLLTYYTPCNKSKG